MAIDLPNNPSVGDKFTSNGRTWQWNGTAWISYGHLPDPTILKVDAVNNLVGINNATPSYTLDVGGDVNLSGNITVGGSYVGLSSDAITDADGDTKIQVEESADEDTIRFDTAGVERMSLSSSGLTLGSISSVESKINNLENNIYGLENRLSTWRQLGQDIAGLSDYAYEGWSVEMSNDGSTFITGAPYSDFDGNYSGEVRVFEWNGSSWQQKGATFQAPNPGDTYGISVSMTPDGSIIAIGASDSDPNGSRSGHVEVYEWNGSAWAQIGSDINGPVSSGRFGGTVDLNTDGDVIVIGAYDNTQAFPDTGRAYVYVWNGSSWAQRGSDLAPPSETTSFGSGVQISGDGTRIVISGRNRTTSYGFVTTFDWNGSSWVQAGSTLADTTSNSKFGQFNALSLTPDGLYLAVGASFTFQTVNSYVEVYKWNGSDWALYGSRINNSQNNEVFGSSVSISSDATRVAIGATHYDEGTVLNKGRCGVYDFVVDDWYQQGDWIDGLLDGDIMGSEVALSGDGTRLAIGANQRDANPPSPTGTSDDGEVRVFHQVVKGASVLQTAFASTTTLTNTTSTTYVDTTLSVTINPMSDTSDMFILLTGHVRPRRTSADNSGWGYMNIVRDKYTVSNGNRVLVSTQIAETASRIDVPGTGTVQQQSPAALSILDSPATTGPITYKVQIKASSPATIDFSGQGFTSAITVFEVTRP